MQLPTEELKQYTNQTTVVIQKKSFYCWVSSSKNIQLCSFQLSWKSLFVWQHSNGTCCMLSLQAPEQLKQNKNKKTAPIQKKGFYCWVSCGKKIQLCSFLLSWKILFVLQYRNNLYPVFFKWPWCAFQIFGECQGQRTGVGVTTMSNH